MAPTVQAVIHYRFHSEATLLLDELLHDTPAARVV